MRSIGRLGDFSDISSLGIKEIRTGKMGNLASHPISEPRKVAGENDGRDKRKTPEITE